MKRFIPIVLCALITCLVSSVSPAATPEVPVVMGYHSAVTDEGGNPISDGDWGAWFRITDVNGAKLYEERQDVTAIGGRISTLIGNGLTADGAPTGGVPLETLSPDSVKFLEVEIEGMDPLPAVEMAAVPYCSYSQVALGAAEGSISYDALAPGTVDMIAGELTDGAGSESIVLREELTTIYSDPSSATYIGVATTGIDNSTSSDLQNVLDDLDGAIAANESSITAESANRASAVSAETTARAAADSAEASARTTADNALDGRVAAVEAPNRLSFTRSIWGTVYGDATFYGANASASSIGLNNYQVSFTQSLSSANYAVVATPNHNTGLGSNSPATLMLYDKTASGFKVAITPSSSSVFRSFDFIVIGN
jgi:hypothetical protein